MPIIIKRGTGIGVSFILVAALAHNSAKAQIPAAASESYSLEYVSVATSGADVTTVDYAMISQVQTKGVHGQTASSGDYSVAPLVAPQSVRADIFNWSLYY